MGIEPATSRVENHAQSYGISRLARFDGVAETAQLSDHLSGAAFCGGTADSGTAFLITDGSMENHPDETTQTVFNGSNGLSMTEPRHKSAIDKLKNAAFSFDSCVRDLIQEAFHLPVAFGRAVTVIDSCTFFFSRADAHSSRSPFASSLNDVEMM